MPNIYVTRNAGGGLTESPEYVAKGISGEHSDSITAVFLAGIPAVPQVAYAAYVSSIHAFLYATVTQTKVFCNKFMKFSLPFNQLIALNVPPIFVAPFKPLKTDTDKSSFMASVKADRIVKYGNKEGFLIENPNLATCLSLGPNVNPKTPSPPNATSLFGLRTMLTTMKILTAFLATHTYPAFSLEEDDGEDYPNDAYLVSTLPVPELGSRYSFSAINEYQNRCGLSETDLKKEIGNAGGMDVDHKPDETIFSMKDLVQVAKPAPFRASINVGRPNDIPNMGGYLFPYFSGCMRASSLHLPSVMAQYFIGTFGNDEEEAAKQFLEWKSGFGTWYTTETGLILDHMFLGVKLALQSQARLFIITTKEYLGFALLGYRFSIVKENSIVARYTALQLRAAAVELDQHSNVLEKICQQLSAVKLKGEGKDARILRAITVKSTRRLYIEINRRETLRNVDLEDRELELLTDRISKLRFVENFRMMTPIEISNAVLRIPSEDLIPEDYPMYLPANPTFIYDTSREFQILSSFGPWAPSFIDMSGSIFDIPYPLDEEDPASTIVAGTGKRPLEALLISGKKLEVAVGDWRHMVKKRQVKMNQLERAGGHRTMKWYQNDRDKVWNALKKLPGVRQSTGSKRKVDAEVDKKDEEKLLKKAKTAEEKNVFSLDDF